MTKIALRKFGNVRDGDAKRILAIMEDLYGEFEEPPDLVELLLFEDLDLRNAQVAEEARNRSAPLGDPGEGLLSIHECWGGSPRVYISLDIASSLPEGALRGMLEHEVGHTVLHGSLESYIFPLDLVRDYEAIFGAEFARALLTIVAASVKDFEVTRLWAGMGASRDQMDFVDHFLSSNEEEKASYAIAKSGPDSALLFLASIMKPVACAHPLTMDPAVGPRAERSISEFLSFMDDEERRGILGILGEISSRGSHDTLENVMVAMENLRLRFPHA
jgi:hypothetical protein